MTVHRPRLGDRVGKLFIAHTAQSYLTSFAVSAVSIILFAVVLQ